jgi:hypothetical protein
MLAIRFYETQLDQLQPAIVVVKTARFADFPCIFPYYDENIIEMGDWSVTHAFW